MKKVYYQKLEAGRKGTVELCLEGGMGGKSMKLGTQTSKDRRPAIKA